MPANDLTLSEGAKVGKTRLAGFSSSPVDWRRFLGIPNRLGRVVIFVATTRRTATPDMLQAAGVWVTKGWSGLAASE